MLRLKKIVEVDVRLINAATGGNLEPGSDVTLSCDLECATVTVVVRVEEKKTDEEYLAVARREAIASMKTILASMDGSQPS